MSIYFPEELSVTSVTSTFVQIDGGTLWAERKGDAFEVCYEAVDGLAAGTPGPGLVLRGDLTDPIWQEAAAKALASHCDGCCSNCCDSYDDVCDPIARAWNCFAALGTAYANREEIAESLTQVDSTVTGGQS